MGIDLLHFGFRFVKIISLLFVISSVIGFLRTYLPQQKIKEYLIIKKGIDGHITASILGAITPFSSQSSNKLFLNFLDSGVPLGIAFSFLITSPIINEYIAILMILFFGWKITIIYIVFGILIGALTGFILGKLNLENKIRKKIKYERISLEKKYKHRKRISVGLNEGIAIINKMWFLVLLGVIARILIQIYLPGNILMELSNKFGLFGVPIAIIFGIPFPGNGAAIIPITFSLFEKGLPLGTTFGFLIAVVALSVPKIIEFKKIMEPKLIFLFLLMMVLSITIISYLLNFLI